MSLYTDYLSEIESRKKDGLKPKPIEDGALESGNAYLKNWNPDKHIY